MGKQLRLFASKRESCALCQEGGEKGSAPPRAEKNYSAYILVRKEKTYIFNADEIKCFFNYLADYINENTQILIENLTL